ncbi:MAG: radical SAM protein [Elusimicrobia bacterium]|nr:radical SAM protein [Elusimicrobiota bacterium]
MRSLKLITGYTCNNSCGFCWDREYRGKAPDKSHRAILAELVEARRAGAEAVDVLGGESSLRKDIFAIFGAAKRLGFRQRMLTTNGWMFADRKFVAALLEAGVTEVRFSVHGDRASVHDGLTGTKGGFARILKGVANLRAAGFRNISANTTVVRKNVSRLPRIRTLLGRLGMTKWNIIYVGERAGEMPHTPRVKDAAPVIIECLRAGEPEAALINAPVPCLFREVSDRVEMFERQARQYVAGKGRFRKADRKKLPERRRIPACRGCAMRGECDGVYADYIRRFGTVELPRS